MRKETSLGKLYQRAKRAARIRKLEFLISKEEFADLRTYKCFYCEGALPKYGSGLDRVNSKLGYYIQNVVPCCSICNSLKGTLSKEELLAHLPKFLKSLERL
jgi:hypothetical protein